MDAKGDFRFHRTITSLLTQHRTKSPLIMHIAERTQRFSTTNTTHPWPGVKDFLIALSFATNEQGIHVLPIKAMTVIAVSQDAGWLAYPFLTKSNHQIHLTKNEVLLYLDQRTRDLARFISPIPVQYAEPERHPFIEKITERKLWEAVCLPQDSGITWNCDSQVLMSQPMKGQLL